jgi:hypothetical protein
MEGMSAIQRSAPVHALDWRFFTGKLRFAIQTLGGNVRFGSKAVIPSPYKSNHTLVWGLPRGLRRAVFLVLRESSGAVWISNSTTT